MSRGFPGPGRSASRQSSGSSHQSRRSGWLPSRVPTFDIGEFAAMGFTRADVPAVEAAPQRLQLFC